MIAEQQKKMMAALYGEEMKIHSTTLENDWLMTMGPSSPQPLLDLLDAKLRLLMDDAAFQKNVLAVVPKESEGLVYFSLTSVVDWAMGLAQTMGAPVPQAMFERGPGIIAVMDVNGARVAGDVTIPAVEIKNLVDGFKQMKQQAPAPAQEPVQAEPAPAPPPNPAR